MPMSDHGVVQAHCTVAATDCVERAELFQLQLSAELL